MKKYQPYQPSKWEARLDNAIKLIAPRVYHQRVVAREQTNYFRYLAAYSSTARRNTSQLQVGETIRGSREKMQIMWNSINLIDNSGLCSSLLWKIQMYICGTLRFQSLCGDKAIAQEYEDYMKMKCGKALDYTGRFGLRQGCMLDVKGMLLKGDMGCNIVRQGQDLYLQGIEAERIGDPTNYVITNNYVRGLRIDDTGIVTGVDVYYRERQSGIFKFDATIPMRDARGLPRFLFMVNPISYDDYRGVSVFKSAIDNATYIDRMREYELQALMWAASQSGIYHTKSGTLPEQLPFDKLTPLIDESGNNIATYQVRPNTVTAVGMGEDVSMFQHDRPSPNVLGMVKDTIRDICVGVGVSFEFGWDMSGLNGPAVRGVAAQDARAFEVWQELLTESKLDPAGTLLLGNGIAVGDVPYHPKWNRWRWQFPAKSTIDASRESNSNIEEIAAGINTGARVCADDNLDIDEVQEQLGKETQQKIQIAMNVAKEIGGDVNWREVYNYMFPPRKGAAAPGVGGIPVGPPKADAPGVTTDGAEIDNEDGNNGNGSRFSRSIGQAIRDMHPNGEREKIVLRHTKDGMEVWYSPNQARDDHGRFADEGGGLTDAERAAHLKLIEAIEARGGTPKLGIAMEDASEEGKGWKAFYAVDKRMGRPLSRMLVSPESANRVAVRLLQTMPGEQGKGYGTALLEHAKTYAKKQGATELISDPEGGTTKKAGRLWEKMGAKKIAYKGAKGGYVWQVQLRDLTWHELWYREDQQRDDKGKFEDEGKGSEAPGYVHPGQKAGSKKNDSELTGIDKKIVDYKPDRALSDASKTDRIDKAVPNVRFTPYSKTPFFNRVNRIQGTPEPDKVDVADYVAARDKLFASRPVSDVPLDKVVATQPMVNKERVEQLVANPETGGDKPIQAVRHNGETYILNGHHRVAADIQRGEKSIKAHVLEIVDEPKSDADIPRYVNELKNTNEYRQVASRLLALAPQGEGPGKIENYTLDRNTTADGKLTPDRAKLHESIVNLMLNPKATVPAGQRPHAILLIGQPGSGKTTAGGDYVKKYGEATTINPDEIRAHLPEYEGWNAPATQAESKMITKDLQLRAMRDHQNIVFDETGSNTEKMLAKAAIMKKAGYDVNVVAIRAPLHQSAHVIWDRFQQSGRFVDMDYLINAVDHRPDNTFKALKTDPNVQSWVGIDNTNFKAKVIEQGHR